MISALRTFFTLFQPGWSRCISHWSSANGCCQFPPWCDIFLLCFAHAARLLCPSTRTSDESLVLFGFVCVALVVPAAQLEQLGSDSPWLHGLPHLRWGQSAATEVHPQAWQVRNLFAYTCTHLVIQSKWICGVLWCNRTTCYCYLALLAWLYTGSWCLALCMTSLTSEACQVSA